MTKLVARKETPVICNKSFVLEQIEGWTKSQLHSGNSLTDGAIKVLALRHSVIDLAGNRL
jgi:hypothetical protein